MLNKLILILCFKSEKFAFWLLCRDINKLTKIIYNIFQGAQPTCNKEQASKIAQGIIWNTPNNLIKAIENIK